MPKKETSATPMALGGGRFGNVAAGRLDTREDSAAIAARQCRWLAARYNLAPTRAALIAGLALTGGGA